MLKGFLTTKLDLSSDGVSCGTLNRPECSLDVSSFLEGDLLD